MISQHYLKQLKKFLPFAILLLAFFLQMQYLAELRDMFPGGFNQPFCGIDAEAHVNRAESLLDGTMLAHGVNSHFYFIPMYPFFLAVLKIFGENSILVPIFLQVLLQLLGIAALYDIGRMAFSYLTGLLAALGMATYSYYIYYLPCFDQSLLTVPFFTLSIFLILKYRHTNRQGWLLAGGITLAGAILSRPTFLLILPIILIWLYVTNPLSDSSGWRGMMRISRKRLKIFGKQILLLALPLIVVVLPITWHNYQSTGRFILISSNFDVNLFTGNNPYASGLDTLAHAQGQPAELYFRDIMKREDTTLTAEALRFITGQPQEWLKLMMNKTWLWFGESDERLVTPVFPSTVQQSQTLSLLPLDWQALAIVALLGLLLVRGHSHSQTLFLWLIYGVFSAATIFFFVQLRFRLPLIPFMLLLAASLLASARWWHHQRPRYFWFTLIILLLFYPIVPALWIFILFFAGYGLLPNKLTKQTIKRKRTIYTLLAISVYLLLVGWWVKASTLASDVSQDLDHYLGPPLAGQSILGQSFKMDCDGLHHIEITLGTFNDPHDQPVNFYLATDLSGQEIIYSEIFEGSSVKDYQKKMFFFEPVPNSAGQTYFFFLSSPTSTPKNAITARGYTDTPIDRYLPGSAFTGKLDSLRKVEADFAFTAFCQMSW